MVIGQITEEGIRDLESRLGSYYRGGPGLLKVTEDEIRLHAQSIGDTNPLYLDPDYGRASPYGSIIAAPLAMPASTALPTRLAMHLGWVSVVIMACAASPSSCGRI